MGDLTQEHIQNVKDFITELHGWLVYNKTIIPSKYNKHEPKYAPRTAIGTNNQKEMVLLQIDGCQDCAQGRGVTLYDMARIMLSYDVMYSINLDGGGSSTSVLYGDVINPPTCLDVDFECERKVGSILCLQEDDTTSNK